MWLHLIGVGAVFMLTTPIASQCVAKYRILIKIGIELHESSEAIFDDVEEASPHILEQYSKEVLVYY